MNISRAEMETTIRWDAEERVAHVFSADPVYIRKLTRLCDEFPDVYKLTRNTDDGIFVETPANRIAFRKPPTEARREAGRRNHAFQPRKPTSTPDSEG